LKKSPLNNTVQRIFSSATIGVLTERFILTKSVYLKPCIFFQRIKYLLTSYSISCPVKYAAGHKNGSTLFALPFVK
jgi:hypothetical protein